MDDLAEFAADVESLLGHGLENDECFGMKELGFVDSKDETTTTTEESGGVKVEKEEDQNDDQLLAVGLGGNTSLDDMVMITREPFQFNFDDYDDDVSPAPSCGVEEENDENNIMIKEMKNDNGNDVNDVVFDNKKNSSSTSSMMMLIKKNKKMKKQKHQILLRLDYEAVSTAWATQGGSPWTTGDRPDLDPDSCLPDCMMLMSSSCETTQMINDESNNNYLGSGSYVVGVGRLSNTAALGLGLGLEEGREARVSRYREKRRTRLFSKKIRRDPMVENPDWSTCLPPRVPQSVGHGVTTTLPRFTPDTHETETTSTHKWRDCAVYWRSICWRTSWGDRRWY
uniref:Uncharacterized protein n=1 Tax=Cannabis sativa TaxID=3483 RepID=A0A803PBD7_CANSA